MPSSSIPPPLDPAVDHDRRRLGTATIPPLAALALIWAIFLVDQVFDLGLYRHGIRPRTLSGLQGILFAPLLHGGWEHVINNSSACLVLGWFMVYFFPSIVGRFVLGTALFSGVFVWLFGRDSYHIGASGVVYGLAAYLFFTGAFRRQVPMMAVSAIVVFLYGSMWWNVLPLDPGISWEAHLGGALYGIGAAWAYRGLAPAHVPPPIVLEDDPDDEDQPPLGEGGEGDEANEAELRWKRELAQRTPQGYDPERTSSTFPW